MTVTHAHVELLRLAFEQCPADHEGALTLAGRMLGVIEGKIETRVDIQLDANWQPPVGQTSDRKPKPKGKHSPNSLRRFPKTPVLDPESVQPLADDHPAVVEKRTLFPTTVVEPEDSPRLLISGHNSPKLGKYMVKGPWAGMPIFSLTLEERATCPDTCHMWASCYGNGMPQARRHRNGEGFEILLQAELRQLNEDNPGGFVVRLHQLGDFYSVDYVEMWRVWLDEFPALRVFGYTAWQQGTEIGDAVFDLASRNWPRFAIRFSSAEPAPMGVTTIWRKPEGPNVAEGLVCPAQLGKTECCGTCGLCWSTSKSALAKTIVFIAHGNGHKRGAGRGGGRRPALEGRDDEVRRLHDSQMTNREIADKLDVSTNTYAKRARELGLPPRKKGRKMEVATSAPVARGARPPKPAGPSKTVPIEELVRPEQPEFDGDEAFDGMMRRRCPGCQKIFKTMRVDETVCRDCRAVHARTEPAA